MIHLDTNLERLQVLENMLLDTVRGPHADWTPQDLEDIARRVRAQRPA